MRLWPTIAPIAVAQAFAVSGVRAQPNLPPPPPPPMGQPSDLPPPASQPPPPSAASPRASAPASSPPPRRASPPPASAPAPTPYRAPRRRRVEVFVSDEEHGRPIALTLDPIPLVLGRLSANAEVLLSPHHAIVGSPNLLIFQLDRGGRYSLTSEGFGFASPTSGGFGIELGYHYWWQAHDSLRGPFFGPSLLLGATTQASVGDPSHAQGYWGFAFDVGGQEVFLGGFTIGGGAGLGIVKMADATALFPRLLVQVGWSP